jgi:hypothetical protein
MNIQECDFRWYNKILNDLGVSMVCCKDNTLNHKFIMMTQRLWTQLTVQFHLVLVIKKFCCVVNCSYIAYELYHFCGLYCTLNDCK